MYGLPKKQVINGMHLPGGGWGCVEVVDLEPGSSCGEHLHAAREEIYVITAGHAVMRVNGDEGVDFKEKPQTQEGWINGGFFVFEPEVFEFLNGDETVLEDKPLLRLAEDRQIAAFPHRGFWQPMDTFRESQLLNNLWNSGNPPWKVWQ